MSEETGINVLLEETRAFPPSPEFSKEAHIKSMAEYEAMYKRSVEDPDGFWGDLAEKELTWYKKWDKVLDYDFEKPFIKWFEGGKLNASVNCLDRHLSTPRKNKAAII
jgi:acetyl-CoA synthetase